MGMMKNKTSVQVTTEQMQKRAISYNQMRKHYTTVMKPECQLLNNGGNQKVQRKQKENLKDIQTGKKKRLYTQKEKNSRSIRTGRENYKNLQTYIFISYVRGD